jgi:putative ABC transport system permease protein
MFASVAVLTLGLAIGANVTMFTVVRATLFAPPPVRDIGSLFAIYMVDAQNVVAGNRYLPTSYDNYRDLRERTTMFADVAVIQLISMTLSDRGAADPVNGEMISANYFDVLGVRPELGRGFAAGEDDPHGGSNLVVLSHAMWARRFGGERTVIGRTIQLNSQPFTIIGVMPPRFKGTWAFSPAEVFWVSLAARNSVLSAPAREVFDLRRGAMLYPIGRLKPGATARQAAAEMAAIGDGLAREYPRDDGGRTLAIHPLGDAIVGINELGQYVRVAQVLTTVVGCVLLIACVNLANLLLARAAGRTREMAVRGALGATRARLVRQVLTEGVLLSALGGAAGLLLAIWGRAVLWSMRPPFLADSTIDLTFDWRVAAFTAVVAVGTGLVFATLPAIRSSRPRIVEALSAGGRAGHVAAGARLRQALVMAEVMLAAAAVAGSGLFLRSLEHAQHINPGFESQRLFVFSTNLDDRYTVERGLQFVEAALREARSVPGVVNAAVAGSSPLGGASIRSVFLDDRPPDTRGVYVTATSVTTDYFDTMRIPWRRGRLLTAADNAQSARVAIVSESFAKRFWPGGEALGRRLKFFTDSDWRTIVGIVPDVAVDQLGGDPRPFVYVPLTQLYVPGLTVHVRTSGAPDALLPVVRERVQRLDPAIAIVGAATIAGVLDQVLWAPRTGAQLLAMFAVLAVLLALIGIYGVMSYTVNQRRPEIGIRMALGADTREIRQLVLRDGMTPAIAGLIAGVTVAMVLGRWAASLLYDVPPWDLPALGVTAICLILSALAACWLPSVRAARTDPLRALSERG